MAEERHHTEHVPQWKKDEIENIKELIQSHKVFGMVGIEGILANKIQKIRRDLKDVAVLKVSRNTLTERALNQLGETIPEMNKYLDKQTALVFTNESPFKLYKLLEQTKTPSPIKGGAIAPVDIIVQKGPTSFPPGPILGEFQSAGIPASIEAGKVAIKETKVVCKAGEAVPQKLATMLAKLEIFPLIVGLDMRAAYEEGTIYGPELLAIDEGKYFSDIISAVQNAFNLSVNTAYPTSATIGTLLAKAHAESKNLGVNAVILEPGVMDALLAKAHVQMTSVASEAADKDAAAVDEDLREVLGAAASAAAAVAPVAAEEKKEEEPEEEEEDHAEEDGMAGLGALFG
ncbi:acidic ribosomal protein P0 [Methanosarcina sp. 2.H.T.1A.6]|uniref:50S ribosomal protein L10 n=1 Tax=unclassified Methanosarcina TaxID=2644672 RepID=UPI000621861F|nr:MULTISPECIES: 50S ribosomal protein L10 [unclassified Methanosarcina]KKG18082.1 acidic ribosomal protein P0 [Methanosarcina sp. 2.H.T.1A.3]KKG20031.1 acidic ribosomal protein P0 [Methanosarcina sp. 2.H.T.1A.6]KKG22695.1 acidic ribosomal protein P0 [Methanosarcina sp. 2.H.T.1A.8]KKG25723.1 acidic ribosomal protein P0 [Methanosarcina sp. 2.H.T.1A.15]